MQVQRILLGLHPSALADSVPAGIALRDDARDAGRLGCGQQVVRPLGAQPDGGGEPPVHVLDIGLAGVHREMAVIWCTIASGRVLATASPTDTASRPSITTAS